VRIAVAWMWLDAADPRVIHHGSAQKSLRNLYKP
jgi:hypothetical protein